MSNRKSAKCRNAERNAKPHDRASQKLIDLLNRPISAHNARGITLRATQLVELFSKSSGEEALSIYLRLGFPADPLAQLYECELSTEFRESLKVILLRRINSLKKRTKKLRPEPEKDDEPPLDEPTVPEDEPASIDAGPPVDAGQPADAGPPMDGGQPEEPPSPPTEPLGEDLIPISGIIPDVAQFLFNIAAWVVIEKLKHFANKRLMQILSKVESLYSNGLSIGRIAGVTAILGYYGFFAHGRKLYNQLVGWRESNLPDNVKQAMERFRPNNKSFDALEQILSDIMDCMDAYDEAVRESQALQEEADDQSENEEDVPTSRGNAIEDDYVSAVLTGQGFFGLPDFFPAIDAIKGSPLPKEDILIYDNARGISVKSANIKMLSNLYKLAKKHAQPLFDEAWRFANTRNKTIPSPSTRRINGKRYQVKRLRKVELHLILPNWVFRRFDKTPQDLLDFKQQIIEIKAFLGARGVKFKWFVYTQSEARTDNRFREGASYLKQRSEAL